MLRALIGPTASGKEGAAVALARSRPVEILSLDSMKLYRGMAVATAKATPKARAEVPHHLLDLADPDDRFSTRRWLEAALAAVEDVERRRRIPLFVGGTALYLQSLLYGLFEGPEARPDIRDRLRALPGEELHRRLAEIDPKAAAKIHPNDLRRLVRALEIHEVTGRAPSELRREWEREQPARAARLVGIRRDRADLYDRIDRRVDRMVEAGLVDEVRALLALPAGLGPFARQALGVKEIADWLEGATESLQEAIRILKSRTRTFARRQLTWFKRFDAEWIDVAPDEPAEAIAARAASALGL